MNHSEVRNLIEQRAAAHAAAVRILAMKDVTVESRQTFDRAMDDVSKLTRQIDGLQAENPVYRYSPRSAGESKRELAFGRFLRFGKGCLNQEEVRSLEYRDVAEGAPMLAHIGTYSGLGYFVPTGFRNEIEQATKYFCPFLDSNISGVTVMDTDTGAPLPMPTSNDTGNTATIVGEASPVSELDVTAFQINLAAYKLSSGLVKCSIELLQDSSFDIQAWLAQRFGERFGRGLEGYLTTGAGSSAGQPLGILNAVESCGISPVITIGSSTNDGVGTAVNSIGSQDLVNLEHSVDPTYRRNARYMFHDATLGSLQKLLDKYGRPLWTPGMAANAPAMVNGYPYVINQSMPQIGSADNVALFGDFSKYVVRRVKDLSVQVLDQLYAVNGQVGFISFARIDANLLDAGTHPIGILQQHS